MFPSLPLTGFTGGIARGIRTFCGLILAIPWLAATPVPVRSFDLGGGQNLEVRWVRAGSFVQGSPLSEANRGDDEYTRKVTITEDFYLGTTEVTVGQFGRFVAASNYRTEAEKGASGGFGWDGTQLVQRREFNWRNPGFPQTDSHPVTGVTYDDARAFCAWLRQRTGQAIDLPTEAQWEYAARAGTADVWPGGFDADAVAWHKGNSPTGTQPVGRKSANPWGFFDLGGNVAEWCRDWYAPCGNDAADAALGIRDPMTSAPPADDKPRRVLRGGSWLRDPKNTRVAARHRNDPKSRNADNGFRVSLPVTTTTAAAPVVPNPRVPAGVAPAVSKVPATVTPTPIRPTPVATPMLAASDSSWRWAGLLGLLCPLSAMVFVIGLIVAVVRKLRGSTPVQRNDTFAGMAAPATDAWIPARTLSPDSIGTEIRDDGFRMLLTGVAVGELIRYTTHVGGRLLTETVPYEPGTNGQFIYTGVRPDSVSVLGVAAGSEHELPGQTTIREMGPGGMASASTWGSRLGGSNLGGNFSSGTAPNRTRSPAAYE